MLAEGIYGFTYRSAQLDVIAGDWALVVLRNGSILGSDRAGGVFSGRYEYDTVAGTNKVHVRMKVPPRGELVTGYAAGPEGAVIDISGSFEDADHEVTGVVEIEGQPVEIRLSYLGPLPN